MENRKKMIQEYLFLLILYSFFIILAFWIDSPSEIIHGMKRIILSPDILISDYIEIGGIGAALVNASLTSLICIIVLIFIGIKPDGSTFMALFLMTGFSFFGKNIFNVWPIIIGVYLFSKYKKESIRNYYLVAILATTLAPTVSQFSFIGIFPKYFGIIVGYIIGIFIGGITPPIAAYCLKFHNGYNLYNVGFASGLIATLLMSILRSFGIEFDRRLVCHTGSNFIFTGLLFTISFYFIIIGFKKVKKPLNGIKKINKESGRLISDFYFLYGNIAHINVGILGIFSTIIVVFLKSELNGPSIGGIFTIMGFGYLGKNLKNIIPVMLGAVIASVFNVNEGYSSVFIVYILFSTALAPIAGEFGSFWGFIAGVIHIFIVNNIGYLHGGLNLYNNGLSAGFVVMIMLPLINTLKNSS